jgi:hypothetical protein
MFDPLSSSGGFADDALNPPWPTTPHTPNSPIPGNLRRASTPVPPTPDKGPAPGPFGKEPQIYGQPDSGLISPREAVSSNGSNYEKPEPYLRVRITGLDRNRRDILVKLDAQVRPSLSSNVYFTHAILARLTCPISRATRIGMSRVRTSSSSSSTSRSYTATRRPLSLHYRWRRRPRRQTRRMTVW